MFDIVSKLLMTRQLKFQEGKIDIVSLPVVLGPVEPLVLIQQELEKQGLQKVIYYAGKTVGYKWFFNMNKIYPLKDMDVFKWGNDLITLGGWGISKLIDYQPKNRRAIFTLENSRMVSKYTGKEKVVDHYYRGLLAGACSLVMGKDIDVVETKCSIDKKNKSCKFIAKPLIEFDHGNSELLKQITFES